MKAKQINLHDGRDLLVVELPKGAHSIVTGSGSLSYQLNKSYGQIGIPQGKWQLRGRLPDISEEQASTIVEYFTTDEDFGKEVVFRDYLEKTFHGTALESLDSLLEANGVLFENPYEIPNTRHYSAKELENDNSKYWKRFEQWQAAQEQVFDIERTYLFLKVKQ